MKIKIYGRKPRYILCFLLKLMMRAFIFMFCALAMALNPNKGVAQKADISITDDVELSLKQVFRLVNKQTDYKFIYRYDYIKNAPKVNINKGSIKVETLLRKSLAPVDLIYEFTEDKTIIVRRKTYPKSPNTKLNTKVFQVLVSGTVTDLEGVPLPGANIIEKGTTNGVQTDFDGNFSIETTTENPILVVSYIGFKTKEVVVNAATNILSIALEEDTAGLDEVVVIGYGSVRKADLTGAVATIKSADIVEVPTPRLDDALRGTLPGVEVTPTSSEPGAPASIRIRGTNSVQGNSSPLFVIDGFIGAGNNVFINNADIESVQVLKDASATALYGSRGSAGVVLITTKRGRPGKTRVNYSTFASLQSAQRLLPVLNAREFAEFQNEVKGSQVFDPDAFGAGTNWQEEVYGGSALLTNHTLSVSGGNEKATYYISGNYLDQDGIYANSDLKRAQFRINGDYQISDRLKLGTAINFARTVRNPSTNTGDIEDVAGYLPTLNVRDENGDFAIQTFTGEITNDNPISISEQIDAENFAANFLGVFYGEYEILKNLKWKTNLGFNLTWATNKIYEPSTLFSETITGGTGSIVNSFTNDFLIENTLTYQNSFGKHNLNAFVGYTRQTIDQESSTVETQGFVSDVLGFNDLSAGEVFLNSGSTASTFGIESFIGRVNYDFDRKYLFTLSARYDGASNFSEGNKFGLFPSAAFAWRVSEEAFMEDSFFSELKFRASMGRLGNPAANGSSLSRLEVGNPYIFGPNGGQSNSIQLTRIGNPNLQFETTDQFDIGIDGGFFNNNLLFTLDYYNKTTNDLFTNRDILLVSGVTNLTVISNFGSMKNSGFELGLDAIILNKSDWKVTAGFNIATNKNELVSIPEEDGELRINTIGIASDELSAILREGEPVGSFFGFVADGIWNNQEEIDASGITTGQTLFPGGRRYVDLSGPDGAPDGVIDDFDRTILGDPNPDFFGGFNTMVTYKNLTLSTNWNYSVGNEIFNETAARLDIAFDNNVSAIYADRWTPTNTESNVVGVLGMNRSLQFADSNVVEDGSFLRLRTVSLSYNLPTDKLKWISSARVYLTGVNPILFDNYSGYDPNISRSNNNIRRGYDNSQDPSIKAWTIGLNASF